MSDTKQQIFVTVDSAARARKGLLIFIIILVLILISGGAGFFLGVQYMTVQVNQQTISRKMPKFTPITSPNPSDKTWELYSNLGYNYSFKYPSDWQLSVKNLGDVTLLLPTVTSLPLETKTTPTSVMPTIGQSSTQSAKVIVTQHNAVPYARINISDTKEKKLSIEQLAKKIPNGQVSQITFAGGNATQVIEDNTIATNSADLTLDPQAINISIFFQNTAGSILVIQFITNQPTIYRPLFEQVLATFTIY